MAKRRPEDVLGEWGVRDVTPPSLAERRKLLDEVEINPLSGRPLKRRIRRFRPEADRYLASLGGPLPYMQRLRQIDDAIEAHTARLAHAYAEHVSDPSRWREVAKRWDFGEVNDLIDRHNRYYPIEARLAMDPRTRDYVKVGGRSYRRERLDAAWILARFPA
ncbi:MAG TPA: hypothetical protein VE982_07810 [Gaiellaceae bacterium]|nr:hypothetical protein [Gaiellaceae bacterium]